MEWHRNKNRNARIRELRGEGKSIRAIAKELNIGRAMVSYHCRGICPNLQSVPGKNLSRLAYRASARARAAERAAIAEEARAEWPSVRIDPVIMGFLGIYWGEGGKRGHSISVVNNDPGIIRAAIDALRAMSPASKIDVVVRCYPEHDMGQCGDFWKQVVQTSVRTFPKKWVGKTRRTHSKFGLCTIRFCDRRTRLRILTWLDCWRNDLVSTKWPNFVED